MRLYKRELLKRVPINKYGKLGFRSYVEFVYTDGIEEFNYRLKNRFYAVEPKGIYDSEKQALNTPNKVYSEPTIINKR